MGWFLNLYNRLLARPAAKPESYRPPRMTCPRCHRIVAYSVQTGKTSLHWCNGSKQQNAIFDKEKANG